MAKRESRALRRQRLLEEAAQVSVPDSTDVAVVGGGAAGLVAAITAAEAGARVVVLERDLEFGRSILATGNGRCNFANISLDARRFNCPEFVSEVCGARWLDEVLAFFKECGLRWSLEDDRLYPMSFQAASVRNVLLARARRADVVLAPACEVTCVEPPSGAGAPMLVTYRTPQGRQAQVTTRAVVVAVGGAGLEALDGCGLDVAAPTPVLCPIACEPSPLAALDGRRVHAQVRLTKAGSFFPSWQERGEVLFRDYGISGVVVFDLSRRASAGDLVEVDLAPDLSESMLRQLVDPFAGGAFESGCLDGVLDPVIARLLEKLAHEHWHIDWPERREPTSDSAALLSLVKALPLLVEGPADVEHAQVTRGGLAVGQFDPSTLAAHSIPTLFACGEALDVDGDCGGFNLGWAWKSGMVAGAATREAYA